MKAQKVVRIDSKKSKKERQQLEATEYRRKLQELRDSPKNPLNSDLAAAVVNATCEEALERTNEADYPEIAYPDYLQKRLAAHTLTLLYDLHEKVDAIQKSMKGHK